MPTDAEEKTEEDLMDGVWRCLAVCLWLGEIEFKPSKK
jgi:hypothetical protein